MNLIYAMRNSEINKGLKDEKNHIFQQNFAT